MQQRLSACIYGLRQTNSRMDLPMGTLRNVLVSIFVKKTLARIILKLWKGDSFRDIVVEQAREIAESNAASNKDFEELVCSLSLVTA